MMLSPKVGQPLFFLALSCLVLTGCPEGPVGPAGGVATITVTPSEASIEVNQTQQFTAQAKDSSGNGLTGVTFTWTSSDESIAAVDASGLATGKAQGQVTIKSASGAISGTGPNRTGPQNTQKGATEHTERGQVYGFDHRTGPGLWI